MVHHHMVTTIITPTVIYTVFVLQSSSFSGTRMLIQETLAKLQPILGKYPMESPFPASRLAVSPTVVS